MDFMIKAIKEAPGRVLKWKLEFLLPDQRGGDLFVFGLDVTQDFQPTYSLSTSMNRASSCICEDCEVSRILRNLLN